MTVKERLETLVYKAIDNLNSHLPGGQQIAKTHDASLYGKTGKLESLDFVEFIVDIESKMQEEFGKEFFMTDENLLSKELSPFQTVGTLIDYLADNVESE